ncbi:MAG: YbaK/EbsC family protein, partial [Nitriliruptorales bacterium]|nr:YbaK/EbsC family protein [Nitriliruptorales bacterium]
MTLVVDHLERRGVRFEVLPHPPATSAQQEAEVLGVSPLEVLKVLVLDTESGHALAVIPSYRRLDLHLVRRLLGDRGARLAT